MGLRSDASSCLGRIAGKPLRASICYSAEITGQPCKTGCLRKPLIWRGVQRCFTILQLGFLPFGKVSPARNSGLISSGGRLELIWTEHRASRSRAGRKSHTCSGDRNSSNRKLWKGQWLSQPTKSNIACDERDVLHTTRTGRDWPLMAVIRKVSIQCCVRTCNGSARPSRCSQRSFQP